MQLNLIGIAGDTVTRLGNANGVVVSTGASGNTIGGTASSGGQQISLGNTIAANNTNGVLIEDGATTNQVLGNFIGTNPLGAKLEGNVGGVDIVDAFNNVIGGTTTAARNYIDDSTTTGIQIIDTNGLSGTGTVVTSANLVEGNFIGVGPDGVTPLPNSTGVLIDSAPLNFIGASAAGARNVISGNSSIGVQIQGSPANSNVVAGNYIGTTADGTQMVPNPVGVEITGGATLSAIGLAGDLGRNVISGNSSNAVVVTNAGALNALINNYIGVTAAGTDMLPNTGSGVLVTNSPTTMIGGDAPGTGNVISGNGNLGIGIAGPLSAGTQIRGNDIGTDKDVTKPLPNLLGGVAIAAGAGGVAAAIQVTIAGNVISGNSALRYRSGRRDHRRPGPRQ